MASSPQPGSPISPGSNDENMPSQGFPPGPPSVISSRMTDIASEDGDTPVPNFRKSGQATDSRPGTAITGISSSRGGAWPQSLPLRQSMQRGSISGSVGSARPQSAASKASRSHAPLASHAFFRPMSSQKLQAQRGAARPLSISQPRPSTDLPDEDDQSHIAPLHGRVPVPAGHEHRPTADPVDAQLPPSRGTETTELYDHVTTTTSPTHGYYPTASITDSASPLYQNQAKEKGLSLNLGNGDDYRNAGNPSSPRTRTLHSFGSSLFISGMGDPAANRPSHDMHGAEKLSSGASTPRLTPRAPNIAGSEAGGTHSKSALGRNYEYFEGNTVFCLDGRLQNTRHRPINIGTGFAIVLPAALFFGACAPYLWLHLSPAVPVIFAYIFVISLSSFIRASASDPGVRFAFVSLYSNHGLTCDSSRSFLVTFINFLRRTRTMIRFVWPLQLMTGL